MINAHTIDGLTRAYLALRYDNPKPVPDFHMEMWDLFCSDVKKAAIAAPRQHAKSTAITHAFVLAMMLFRIKQFCLLVSDTEGQAAEFLGDIKVELNDNEGLREAFSVRRLVKETETNLIVEFDDGERFRIVAKGSEQKVRGLKWRGKRPDLIVGDDLENDEIVMNPDRRLKFRNWFNRALIPCGSDTCWVRIVGTVLHMDSMLNNLLDSKIWKTLRYEAHNSDFSKLLWPEKFSKKRLLSIRAGFEEDNDLDGYSQEYLNKPVAPGNAFFSPDYFYDFERDGERWLKPNLEYFAAADFAIDEKERADYTAIVVAGVCPEGYLYVVDAKRGRWDSERIIDELIATQNHYQPNLFTFETAKIDKAIGPFLEREQMRLRTDGKLKSFINIHKETPTKSKTARAKSVQGMHKSGVIRYDKMADWYPDFYAEMQTITDSGPRGKHDDYFDAFAYIGLTVDMYFEAMSDEEKEDEEYDEVFEQYHGHGRCFATGY